MGTVGSQTSEVARDIYDYEHVLVNFIRDLHELADHIEEHNYVADAPETVAEIRAACELGELSRDYPYELEPDYLKNYELQQQAWDGFWEMIKDRMQGWWD